MPNQFSNFHYLEVFFLLFFPTVTNVTFFFSPIFKQPLFTFVLIVPVLFNIGFTSSISSHFRDLYFLDKEGFSWFIWFILETLNTSFCGRITSWKTPSPFYVLISNWLAEISTYSGMAYDIWALSGPFNTFFSSEVFL